MYRHIFFKYIILFLTIIFASKSYAIQISFEIENELVTYYDYEKKLIRVITTDSIIEINENGNLSKIKFQHDKNYDLSKKLIPLKKEEEFYFLENGSGKVFTFIDNKFQRIDKSFIDYNYFNSSVFTYNNIIYRYGGYGFWNLNNKIIYLDELTKEWELLITNNHIDGRQLSIPFINTNYLYIIGGENLNQDGSRKIRKINRLNFDTGSWDKSFRLNKKINIKNILNKDDKGLLVFNMNELNKEKSIYYLNLVDNEIIEYAFSPILNDINLEKSVISNSSNLIFYKSEDNNDIINIIPREYILFNEKSIGKLYYNKVNLAFIIPILFILSTFMVILMSLNRGKTLLITENGIRLNNRFSELNKKSIQLIKKIINENKISTYEVNEILFDNSLSRASNYHIKSNIFEEINTKFYYITNSNKKLIINSKSKFDKRMINFKINKDLNLKFKIK